MTETPTPSWAGRHRWGLWVLLGVLLYGVASALTVRDAAADATEARDLLQARIDGEVGVELIDDETLRADLAVAEDRFASSHRQLRAAHLVPVRWLPVVGRQLQSATALAAAGRDISGSAHRTLTDLDEIRAETPIDGAQRMDQIGALRDSIAALAETLGGIEAGPDEALLGALADARNRLTEEVGKLDEEVERASTILEGLHQFLTGPSTYLVMGANNAEMRSGSGTFLSIGELIVENGEFELLEFKPTRDFLPLPGAEVVDQDVQDRWGFLDLAADWRRLNYSARFDDYTGPQAAAMWERTTGSQVDGVMVVDPLVLQAILEVVGGVEVEGDRIESGTVLQDLFFEQYSLGHNDPEFYELNAARSSRLSLIAGATVEALGQPGWEPLELIEALEPVAAGRHLLVWAAAANQQASWVELGVNGAVPADAIMVSSMNWTASKLDTFIDIESRISMEPGPEGWTGQVVVTVANNSPTITDEYAYVLGAWEELGHQRGSYGGRVLITLPGSVTEASMNGRTLEVYGPDGASFVLGTRIVVAPGLTETIVVDFTLDPSTSQITLVPSARIPPVTWVVGGNLLDDSASYTWQLEELFG